MLGYNIRMIFREKVFCDVLKMSGKLYDAHKLTLESNSSVLGNN